MHVIQTEQFAGDLTLIEPLTALQRAKSLRKPYTETAGMLELYK
jgi:hypothetical protein